MVTFTSPYLLSNEYAGLQSKVGFIFGTIAVFAFLFVYFCVPDLQNKSLEEIDMLFHQKVSLRDFKKTSVDVMEETRNKEESSVRPDKVENI